MSDETVVAREARRLPPFAAVLIGIGFVGLAILLSVLQPTEELQLAPYAQTVDALGERYDSRDFALTVTAVEVVERLQADGAALDTDGIWLVIDAEMVRLLDDGSVKASLDIGGVDYATSVRVGYAGLDTAIEQPGLPVAGSFVFELPLAALDAPGADRAVIRFSTASDPVLDGVLDLPVDLGALDRVDSRSVLVAGRVAS